MSEYEIPSHRVNFLKKEIAREIKCAKNLGVPVDYSVDRIFSLMAHICQHAKPMQRKKPDILTHLELK